MRVRRSVNEERMTQVHVACVTGREFDREAVDLRKVEVDPRERESGIAEGFEHRTQNAVRSATNPRRCIINGDVAEQEQREERAAA